MRKLLLASQSPRRRELLQLLCRPFEVEPSGAEENAPAGMAPEELAAYLSRIKAEDVFRRHAGEALSVIGSDTIVAMDGSVFGKPKDEADAFRMLEALSGRTHAVCTGVTVCSRDEAGREKTAAFTSRTEVCFYPLSKSEIEDYVRSGEPMDKAGAYGIQGKGSLLVKEIHGDYFTVVGLPIAELYRCLESVESR